MAENVQKHHENTDDVRALKLGCTGKIHCDGFCLWHHEPSEDTAGDGENSHETEPPVPASLKECTSEEETTDVGKSLRCQQIFTDVFHTYTSETKEGELFSLFRAVSVHLYDPDRSDTVLYYSNSHVQ